MQDCSLGLLNSRAAKDKCRNIRSAIRIILPVYRILNFHNQKDEMSTKCVNTSDWDHREISNPEPLGLYYSYTMIRVLDTRLNYSTYSTYSTYSLKSESEPESF